MDKQEAITKFIRHNLKLFLEDCFYAKVYEDAKRKHFEPIRRQVGIVKDNEIAHRLLEMLIKMGHVKDPVELSKRLEHPFLKANIQDPDFFIQKLALSKKKLDVDLRELGSEEYRRRKIDELAREALERESENINRALEAKKREYESIPSILDEKDYPEPTLEERPPVQSDEDIHWYKLLHLRRDPFPSIDGLEGIDEDAYEDIVVRTNVYQQIINRTNSLNEIYRNMVLYGELGSGKTTLFQYLQKPLINDGIFPIFLTLSAQSEFQTFLVRFKERLLRECQRVYANVTGLQPEPSPQSSLDDQIRSAITSITDTGKCSGIVIIVDEIYKIPEYEQTALTFLSHLQVFRRELIQDTSFKKIGFWISAPPHWERALMHDLRYSGSVDIEERMPIITRQDAIDMINNRLASFAENPTEIKQFDIRVIEQIYRRLESAQRITFRQLIKEVRHQFRRHNFDMLISNPVVIPAKIMEHITSRFDSAYPITDGIEQILQSGMRSNNKLKCFKLLIQLTFTSGIDEQSEDFRRFVYHFQKLRDANLIRKVKTADGRKVWRPSIELIRLVDLIKKETKYSLEDYFFRIYGKRISYDKDPEASTIRSELGTSKLILDEIKNDLQHNSIALLLSSAFELHEKILALQQSPSIHVNEDELIRSCQDSLLLLTKAVANLFKTNEATDLDFWNDFWKYPDSVSTFVKLLGKRRFEEDDESKTDIWFTVSAYVTAFEEIVDFLHEQVHQSRILFVDIQNLRSSEVREIMRIRSLFGNKKYQESLDLLVSLIESKMRGFLYNIFLLQNGDKFNRLRRVPNEIRAFILDNSSKSSYEINEFSSIQIQHLAAILGDQNSIGLENWARTFSHVFDKWDKAKLTQFLTSISEIRTQGISFPPSAVTTLVCEATDFLRMINASYISILSQIYAVSNSGKPRFRYYFPLGTSGQTEFLEPVIVPEDTAKRVIEIWKQTKLNSIDLGNPEQLQHLYGATYREIIAILAVLIKDKGSKAGVNVTITKHRGTELLMKVE